MVSPCRQAGEVGPRRRCSSDLERSRAMNSHDLTVEQLDQLAEKARVLTAWLHKLKERLEANSFPVDDKLCQQTEATFNRVHELRMTLHYLSCDAGKR